MAYKRILLKVSGEALGGDSGAGFDTGSFRHLVEELMPVHANGIAIAIVVGAGNLVRGVTLQHDLGVLGLDQVTADQMGMLGTIANGLAIRDVCRQHGMPSALFSTHGMPSVVDTYVVSAARQAMEQGKIVICAGGTGNPFFTTDSAACLRGIELGVDVVIKATQVDGVYDADPRQHANARRFESLTFDEVIGRGLGVIDATASTLCRENRMSLIVYAFNRQGALFRIVNDSNEGTIIRVD